MYGQELAFTGMGLSAFGTTVGLEWLLAVGTGVTVAGIALARWGQRRAPQA